MLPTLPAPESLPTGPLPTPPRLRWVALGLLVVVATLVTIRFAGPALDASEAQRLAGELGAELYDRPLLPQELDAPLELAPVGSAPAKPTTLRALLAGPDTVILHFWATWCPPCLDELLPLAQVAAEAERRHCQVLTVASDNDWPTMNATLTKTFGATKPKGEWVRDPFGQDGPPDQLLRTSFGTEKLPETWVLSGGRVLARFVASQDWKSQPYQRWLQAQCPRLDSADGRAP